ncbi:MAG: APC family permease [Actinomycetota bacterium]
MSGAQAARGTDPPTRLARRLGTADAVVIGLGSMVGAGIFAAVGPAAEAAGAGLLIGLGVAAIVACANATSSAQLAAVHPVSGGTYAYGRRQLGDFWGFAAGWAFVIGKTASCGALALTIGRYAAPGAVRLVAIAAVVVLTAVNYRGIRKTAATTWPMVAFVVAVLGLFVLLAWISGSGDVNNLDVCTGGHGVFDVFRSGALMFFAFAGYARVATLGEEVVDPARTIPRAMSISVGLALTVYAAVSVAALWVAGAHTLATAPAPLEAAARLSGHAFLGPVMRVGATVAAVGVLLSLLAALSRMVFAMSADRTLPNAGAAVHPRFRVPHRAQVAVGLVVALVAAFAPLEDAVALSAFTVLLYYAITNAAALTLRPDQRRWPRWVAWLGLTGCVGLASTLPVSVVGIGIGLLAVGGATHLTRRSQPRGSKGAEV